MNVMKALFISCFCVYSLLAEDEGMMFIDSGEANYNGKEIVLSKDVVVEHEIGKICAHHIILTPENDQKKIRFTHLKMSDTVKFLLKDGGQLLCEKADLDYLKLTGKFTGSLQHEYVVYTESCKVNGDKRMPLVLKALEMNVLLNILETDDRSSHCISEMKADQNVTLNYNHDLIANSDHAVYQRLENSLNEESSKDPRQNSGQICLTAQAENGICQITNRNGDVIKASKIELDTLKKDLTFFDPKGFFKMMGANALEKIYFESDLLKWENRQNLLIFIGNVTVNQKVFGELQNQNQVKLYYHEELGKKKIKLVESIGETVISHTDQEKRHPHTLVSYGKVIADHLNLQTTINSPLTSNGEVIEGMQIYFNDIFGEIYADKALLEYRPLNGVIKLEKLTLSGHVKILNRSSVNPEESEAFLQYALSDVATFYPGTNELVMASVGTGRVLFYDKANNLQVSALGVKIKRDSVTKKESIKGVGDVRFSLENSELEKLKTHFSLEPAKGY